MAKKPKKLYVKAPKDGYFFKEAGIREIERLYNAQYMGFWCKKRPDGSWTEEPVEVFYQPNPDIAHGHSHYFGIFVDEAKRVMITNAESAFSEPMTGVICDDGEVLISRYRHDFRTKGLHMIDGGRDYTRTSLDRSSPNPTATVTVVDGNFVIVA
jgi:hypothetical protein